jgi:membrane-bound lytic murein transglycosylase A
MRRTRWGAAGFAVAFLCACTNATVPPTNEPLQAARFDEIAGWPGDHLGESVRALHEECRRLALLPPDTPMGGQGIAALYGGKAWQWSAPCAAALGVSDKVVKAAQAYYQEWFQPYRVAALTEFSGYFEPEVEAATVRGVGFTIPLLARPADLVQRPAPADQPGGQSIFGRISDGAFVPYWSRSDIEAGAMGSAARPLFWLRDSSDLFFLQIQGSGRLRLRDGNVVRVGYDGKNGRPYTPIGRVLVAERAIAAKDVTMQAIRGWLAAHPADAKAVMDRNEDYVFFRVLAGGDDGMGPPGALGVPLTPGQSAAVDPRLVPLATPIFVDTTDPISGAPWRRLLLAQDSGTDIRGVARTDIFFGFGPLPEQEAGRMHEGGAEYVLLPRPSK